MKNGLYEIVAMRRSNHGKWVFTARPVDGEISFECGSDALEEELFKYSRETLLLYIKDNPGGNILDYFETRGEKQVSEELTRRESEDENR